MGQMYGPELTCLTLHHMLVCGAEIVLGGADGEWLLIVMLTVEGGKVRDVVVTLLVEATARLYHDEGLYGTTPSCSNPTRWKGRPRL
jgi:hypothetical protein